MRDLNEYVGKRIVFPIPSAVGAFTGYKLSFILQGSLWK